MPSIIEITASHPVSNQIIGERIERAKGGRSRYFIAIIDDAEVGFLCYDDWSDQSNGYILEIYVHPDYRGQGIGHCLLIYSEELAKNLRCKSIRLEPRAFDRSVDQNWLVSWYTKHGYAQMSESPTKMEKFLVCTST